MCHELLVLNLGNRKAMAASDTSRHGRAAQQDALEPPALRSVEMLFAATGASVEAIGIMKCRCDVRCLRRRIGRGCRSRATMDQSHAAAARTLAQFIPELAGELVAQSGAHGLCLGSTTFSARGGHEKWAL